MESDGFSFDLSSADSDSGSSVYSWLSVGLFSYESQIDQLLDSLPFYFGSMLDDTELQTQLLAKPGDAFLVSFPLSKNDKENRCTAYNKWHLVTLERNDVICKLKVIFHNDVLKITLDEELSLMDFISKWQLKPIERPWHIDALQLSSKMPIVPQQAFPINSAAFPLGTFQQVTLNFDKLRRIPVMELSITNCTHTDLQFLLCKAENYKRFGSVRLWRLWGICEYATGAVSLILEDIVYGSLAEYVRTNSCQYSQLCNFAVQIAEGFRYLEKYSFIHRRITSDICMLTYNYNIKIAIYCLAPNTLFPTDGSVDFGFYRHSNASYLLKWVTPRCLPEPDGPLSLYDASAMVYSFGTVLWSIFHRAAIPFYGENEQNIINRLYRSSHCLHFNESLVSASIKEASSANTIQNCWEESGSQRRFRDLVKVLRSIRSSI